MMDNWNINGNFLFDEKEFNNAKSRELLPLKCLYCGKVFFKDKHHIQQIFNRNAGVDYKFCSSKCRGKFIFDCNTIMVECNNCGKKIRRTKQQLGEHKHIFCCQSCAATFNNKHRILSDKTKKKISNALKGTRKCSYNKKWFHDIKLHTIKCTKCGKEIYVKTNDSECYCYDCVDKYNIKEHRHIIYNKCGKRIVSESAKEKNRKTTLQLVKSGKHKGWQSRNKKSYAEDFFEKVLDKHNIKYIRELTVSKHSLGINNAGNYFIDFKLLDNIDLEIDGKQHEYEDRKIHDMIRDKALSDNGWIIYRIKWNNINTNDGKKLMQDKINKFLNWYNNILKSNSIKMN